MIPIGVGLLAFGYALTYYAVNVLVWAHSGDSHVRPVPLRYCLGLPIDPRGPAQGTLWMPLFNLESATPDSPQTPMGGSGASPTGPQSAGVANTAPPPAGGTGGGGLIAT